MAVIAMPLLTLVLLSVGCGEDKGEAFVDEYCGLIAPCCAQVEGKTDGSHCRGFYGLFLSGASYDEQKGEACLADVRAASGQADFCDTGLSPSSCEDVFETQSSGNRKPGETCEFDSDCASSSAGRVSCETIFTAGASESRCQIQVRGTAGQGPCTATVEGNFTSYERDSEDGIPPMTVACYVEDGLRCKEDAAGMQVCTVIAAVGGMCTSSFDRLSCVADAYCDTAMMMCVNRKAVGAACEDTDECAQNAYCDAATSKCVARLANGSACAMDVMCQSDNCNNSKCAAGSSFGSSFTLSLLCGGD